MLFTPPRLSSNMLFFSHLLFSIFTVKLPWHCLVQCTLNMHCSGVKLSSKCFCGLRAELKIWSWNRHSMWTTMNWPATLSFNRWWGLQIPESTCVTQQRFPFTLILGTRRDSLLCELKLCGFFYYQSAGSHIICGTSVAGNSNRAGVMHAWQQVNSAHLQNPFSPFVFDI